MVDILKHVLAKTLPYFCHNPLTRDKLKQRLLYLRQYGLKKYIKGYLKFLYSKFQIPAITTDIAIVAIVQNETPYIREWLEFHKLVGIKKFYIYDNESTDNLKEVLEPYIKSGEVVYKYFPGACLQIPAYQDAIENLRNKVKWLVFIDIDEFLTPIKFNTVIEFIDYLKNKHGKNIDAVGINWLMHGFNGHYEKPEGLVCENFKKCDYKADGNKHIKSIVNPRSVILAYNPHFFIHKLSAKIVNAVGEDIYGPFSTPHLQEIRVNHYWLKSFAEHKERISKPRATCNFKKTLVPYSADYLSCDEDNSMDKFIQLLKTCL